MILVGIGLRMTCRANNTDFMCCHILVWHDKPGTMQRFYSNSIPCHTYSVVRAMLHPFYRRDKLVVNGG